MRAFQPAAGATVNLAVGATTGRVRVALHNGLLQVRIINNGTATAWVRFGDSTVIADVTKDIPIPAGEVEVFTINCPTADALYMAAIAAGSTGNLYVTPGAGI